MVEVLLNHSNKLQSSTLLEETLNQLYGMSVGEKMWMDKVGLRNNWGHYVTELLESGSRGGGDSSSDSISGGGDSSDGGSDSSSSGDSSGDSCTEKNKGKHYRTRCRNSIHDHINSAANDVDRVDARTITKQVFVNRYLNQVMNFILWITFHFSF